MKTTVLVVFLFSFSAHCYAQLDPQKMLYLQESERYRKMKNTGTVLTVVGGILFATGFVTLVNSATGTSSSTSSIQNGFYAYVAGAGCLGAGIPLWAVGGKNQRKFAAKSQGLTVRLNANPSHKGLTFTYRF